MRRGLSQTFRSYLVEFDTDAGLRYAAPPTFWVRVYLIWTFRNFRSLPKQVFNRHQQKLLDGLIRSSTVSPGTRVDRSSLIGTVEQVRLSPPGITQGKANRGATPAKSGVAYGSGQVNVRTTAGRQALGNPASPQTTKPQSLMSVSTTRKRNVRANNETASFLLLGTAALVAVLFLWHGIRVHVRENQVKTSLTTESKPVARQPQIQNVALPLPAALPTEQLSHSADKTERLPARQFTPPSKSATGTQPVAAPGSFGSSIYEQGQLSLAAMLTPTAPGLEPTRSVKPDTSDVDTTLPRLAGPPQFRMIYPTYPETQQSGKVVLTAVIAPDGSVKSITVISGKKIFASAALKAVKRWRYLPYELQGKSVEFQTAIAFEFRGDEVITVSFPHL